MVARSGAVPWLPESGDIRRITTTLETRTPPRPDLHTFEHHWQDEADAAYLYRVLAGAEPDPKKKDVYRAARGGRGPARRGLGRSARGARSRPRSRSGRARATRLLACLGQHASVRAFCCRCCSPKKGARSRGISTCIARHRPRRAGRGEALTLASESAEHATTLDADRRPERRAVAPHGVRRIPAQRRLRIQRWADGELRTRRRRDRRGGERRSITRSSSPAWRD